jgi:hypothetical protein
MSTDKGGSDLDVFNDLKPQTLDGKPIIETKKTLMGLQAPEGSFPPVPGSSPTNSNPSNSRPNNGNPSGGGSGKSSPTNSRSIPPPPPSQRPRRGSGTLSLSQPSLSQSPRSNAGISGNDTPVTPRAALTSAALTSAALTSAGSSVPSRGAATREVEDRGEDTNPGISPGSSPDSPVDTPRSDSSGLGLDTWATTQPPGAGPRISLLPTQISTLPDSVASAATTAAAGAANGDIGWDDDDDKTQIYDKDTQAAAQSLLQPAAPGGSLGRPPPPMSRPSGALLPMGVIPPGSAFGNRSTSPPAHDASFLVPSQPAPSQRLLLPYLFAFVGMIVVAMLIWVMLPKKGGLTVTVAGGPGNKELAAVEVIVDNKVRCRASPCELPSLKAGTHYVEVRAAGYQATAKSAVAIVGGQTAVHNVQLIRAGTGIKVFGESSGLTLLVDGKEFGPLPQELREMEPGEHVIQVAGGPRYEIFTQRIIVDPDRMTPIGPVKLKVTKGLATIRAGQGAEDAEVTLKVGDSRRVLPALPVRLEVETDRTHVLIAKRKGYATFEEPLVFEDGQAEKTIEITLTERASEDPAAANRRRRPGPGGTTSPRADGAEAAEPAAEPEPSGPATLNLTSTPPSNVLLDGKPLGSTPLRDITVEPGAHRVIFIYGAERKPKTIEAAPGSTQTVSVSF